MVSASNDDAITDINVTPLVDVTLVLLIIFMVTAKLIAGQGMPLDLPKAASAASVQSVLTLAVDAEGAVLANGQPVPDDQALELQTREALRQSPELRIVIAASTDARHGSVMHVMDLVREAGGVRVAFAAAPASTQTPPGE